MKHLLFLSWVLAAAAPPGIASADSASSENADRPARLLRHPTYSDGKVAFSYLGDIWIANEEGTGIQRLTDHVARDVYPRFSPDGKWIAFSSDRDGNPNVYVVSAKGGQPRQLTFHSAADTVTGWAPDSRRIVFVSTRNKGVFPTVATLFEISLEGGLEKSLPTDWGSWASYSPDGSKLAFTRHPASWSRKHYRGSYAADLWVMDAGTKQFTRLGDETYKGNYLWPMYGAKGEIYFVADRLPDESNVRFGGPEVMASANNIWKIAESGGTPIQVTQHTSGNLFFPSISADGKTIVYEENFGLWKLDTASGNSIEIRLCITSDLKENAVELRTIQGEADSFDLSPSTQRAAISSHGEIFTIATDRGEVQRVTESPWREQNPRWSPDGKWIAFVSDRTGREEVWIANERGQTLKQLTDVDCDKSSIVWAPDSKSLLWSGSDRKLRRVVIDSGETEVIAESDTGTIQSPQFSPDGKWISYAKLDSILRPHVHVRPVEGGEERRIGSDDFLLSTGAQWTPDGKKLLLLGGAGAPAMASLNRTPMQLYSVALLPSEKDPNDRDVDTEEQAQQAEARSRRERAGGSTAGAGAERNENRDGNEPRRSGSPSTSQPAARVEVKIEWNGLDRRFRKLTSFSGSVAAVAPSPDSRTYAFVAQGDAGGADDSGGGRPALYTIAEDGTRLTQVAQSSPAENSDDAPQARGDRGGFGDPQWSKDGRSLFYRQSRGIYTVPAPASPASDSSAALSASASSSGSGARGGRGGASSLASASASPRRVSFTARMEVDKAAERLQVFREAWRVMNNRFYDPNMHGVDWRAAQRRYEPLLDDVADSDELHTVIMQMIGELNASHTGVSGGDRGSRPERVQTRYPGFDLEPDDSGYFKVSHIYRKGPADHDYVKLAVGNFILAVHGKPLRTADNYWRLFNLLPGRKFEFTVNSKPEMEGAWTIRIEPLSANAQADLEYARWVEQRESMVQQLGRGEIGYLHIRAMNAASFQKFQRDLLRNSSKKALIIDQRFNGGGGIDQELLEILNQRTQYQSWRRRDSVEVPRPVQAFFGPMVVLQNERSASNAEMFPEGFRTLGLGKVIGVTTMGAVIGTGSHRLMDGSTIRTPGVAVLNAKGESLENYGVRPDIFVDNTPEDFLADRDRQIETAVETLRAQIQ